MTSVRPDPPDQHGVHYNLHVARLRGDELANYHIYYLGKQCDAYKWRFVDTFGKGGIRLDLMLPADSVTEVHIAAMTAAQDLGSFLARHWGFDQGFEPHLTGVDEDWWDQIREEWGAVENLYDRLLILSKLPPAGF